MLEVWSYRHLNFELYNLSGSHFQKTIGHPYRTTILSVLGDRDYHATTIKTQKKRRNRQGKPITPLQI